MWWIFQFQFRCFSETRTKIEILVPKKLFWVVSLCPPAMFTSQIFYWKISLENKKSSLDLGYFRDSLRDFPTIVKSGPSKSKSFSFSKDILEFVCSQCQIAYRLNWRSLVKFLGVTFLIKLLKSKILSNFGFVHISCREISHNFENKSYFVKNWRKRSVIKILEIIAENVTPPVTHICDARDICSFFIFCSPN